MAVASRCPQRLPFLHLDREQQTAGPAQGNELTPFHVEHGDFLPYTLSEPPTGPCSVFRSFSLPQGGPCLAACG
jgi:hypothetical protein